MLDRNENKPAKKNKYIMFLSVEYLKNGYEARGW